MTWQIATLIATNPFFLSATLVGAGVYVAGNPGKPGLAVPVLGALIITALFGLPPDLYNRVMVFGAYCFVGCLLWHCAQPIWKRDLDLKQYMLTAANMLIAPVLAGGAAVALLVSAILTPHTHDFHLYAFDGSLGFQPGFLAGRLVLMNPWLRWPGEIVYSNLPVGMAIVYFALRRRDPAMAQSLFVAYVAIGTLGYFCYYLLPASGSMVVFGPRFPLDAPPLSSIQMVPVAPGLAPRNCMPSLHSSWALMMLWASRPLPRKLRIFAGVFCVITVIFSVACGHYFVDFVVALPFTVAIYCLTVARQSLDASFKSAVVIACFATVAIWILLLRYGMNVIAGSLWLSWTLVTVTMIGSELLRQAVLNRVRWPAPLAIPQASKLSL